MVSIVSIVLAHERFLRLCGFGDFDDLYDKSKFNKAKVFIVVLLKATFSLNGKTGRRLIIATNLYCGFTFNKNTLSSLFVTFDKNTLLPCSFTIFIVFPNAFAQFSSILAYNL